jgi:hypothetical protein
VFVVTAAAPGGVQLEYALLSASLWMLLWLLSF